MKGLLFGKVVGVLVLAAVCGILPAPVQAQAPGAGALTVTDHSGKEHKLTSWQFVTGVRRLSWPAEKSGGPVEVLEFSEGKGTPLKVRVLTLVPLESLRSLEFDPKKKTVTARVAGPDKDFVLEGVTGYVGVNVVALTAAADLGELGKAELKFQGGVARGIRSIQFSSPKPMAAVPKGRVAKITTTGSTGPILEVVDLQPAYRMLDKSWRLGSELLFQKTVHLPMDKIQGLSQVGDGTAPAGSLLFDVTLKDGNQQPLVLVEQRLDAKKRAEALVGVIGRVEAGYALVPLQRIGQLTFAE
jgi:hypothetical protein